jgi:hypothetical protein
MDLPRLALTVTGSKFFSSSSSSTISFVSFLDSYKIQRAGRMVFCGNQDQSMFFAHTCGKSLDFRGLNMELPRTNLSGENYIYDDIWKRRAFAHLRHFMLVYMADMSMNAS